MEHTKYIALGIILGYLTPYLLELYQNYQSDPDADFFAPGSAKPTHFSNFTNHQR